jgi:hypothetical protein
VNTRRNGKAASLALGMALMLGACSAAAVPSGASNVQAATTAGAAPTSQSAASASDAPAPVSGGDVAAACSMVTPAAVSTATGFARFVPNSLGAAGQCVFVNADTGQHLTVTVYGSQAEMAVMLEAEPRGEHIAGLGDDAFWSPLGQLLFVRKGDRGISFMDSDLGTGSLNDTARRDALVILARTALPNL